MGDSSKHSTNLEAVNGALVHWPAAFGLAAVLVGDRSLAEDICQEAYLKLSLMERRVVDPQRVKPLLMRIVHNLAVSESRRTAPVSLDQEAEYAGSRPDPRSPDPAATAADREDIARVRAVLDGLDPLWRLVLYLRDGLGLRYAEIAEVADRSEDVVRVTLHRARLQVRAAMKTSQDRED